MTQDKGMSTSYLEPLRKDAEKKITAVLPLLKTVSHRLQAHQIEGVRWMLGVEAGASPFGHVSGILADDMGLGKTYQIAGLFFSRPVSTLVVTTNSTVMQWRDAFANVARKRPTLLIHGKTCSLPTSFEESAGLVAVTTYGAIHSHARKDVCPFMSNNVEYDSASKAVSPPSSSCVMDRHWDRVILDEAHQIRNRKTGTFKAMAKLHATHRWALTGTPINNRINDLLALGEWTRLPLLDRGVAERHILRRVLSDTGVVVEIKPNADSNLIAEQPGNDDDRDEEDGNRGDIMIDDANVHEWHGGKEKKDVREEHGSTRSEPTPSPSIESAAVPVVALPSLTTRIVKLEFAHAHERETYATLSRSYERRAEDVLASGSRNNVAMEGLLRLRQAAVHTAICVRGMQKKRLCNPLSMSPSDLRFLRSGLATSAVMGPSTKFEYVVDRVLRFCEEAADSKTLVFCEWVTEMVMLATKIESTIGKGAVCCYNGKLSMMNRALIVRKFETDPVLRVMLVQIKTGGTGLNLQMASNVIITSPNWNPCSEMQAVCRAHRQGQTRAVTCERIVMKDTVEEKCLAVQQRKLKRVHDLFREPAVLHRLGYCKSAR